MSAVHLARRLRPFLWGLSALVLVAMTVWWWSPWTDGLTLRLITIRR